MTPVMLARRRAHLRPAAALALAASLLFVACGGDDSSGGGGGSAATTDGPSAPVNAGGTSIAQPDTSDGDGQPADATAYLRVAGVPIEGQAGLLDPTKSRTRTYLDQQRLFYDTLLRRGPGGALEPGLAKDAELVDAQTIDIELQEGVQFSDGTAFDAEAVKFGLERNLAAKNLTGMRQEIFDITSIDVVDPLHLTLHLGRPVGGAVLTYLAGIEAIIVSPSAARAGNDFDKNPVGAGPFLLERYEPDVAFVVKKNPAYFQADQVKVAGIDFVRVAPGDASAVVNGLRSGQIDVASMLASTQAKPLESVPGLEVQAMLDPNGVVGMAWCKNRPPLDDVRVRRALALATDREAINAALYDGRGEVAWGLYNSDHPLYDPTQVGKNAYDPDEARRLLAEAGTPSFRIGMLVGVADLVRVAEVLQQQWGAVGVQLDIAPTQNSLTDFYQEVKQPILLLADTSDNLQRQYGNTTSVANVCQYADPAFVGPLNRLPEFAYGSPEHKAQLHLVEDLLNELMVNEALVIPPTSTVVTDHVGGLRIIPSALGRPVADLFRTYVIAS